MSSERRSRLRGPWWAAVAIVVVAAAIFRWKVVDSWHVPGGDGLHYHRLSQSLIRDGRYAFGPAPSPLAFTRLPGYPIFLAYIAVRAPADMELNLIRAAHANVLLDVGTALLVLLILRERKLGGALSSVLGLAATLVCPLLVLLSCYGLTETFSTFLATLEIWLALRAMRTRPILHAALCGVVAGVAQLTRADAATVAPAVALAIAFADFPRRTRLLALGACVGAAVIVFLPWPVRNLVRFHRPYLAATYWRDSNGNALPDEPVNWERTWGSGAEGESHLDLFFYFNHRLEPNGRNVLQPVMYDDEAERRRVLDLFQRYAKEKFSPPVTVGFAALARERARRAPWRTFVELPAKRIKKLWSPVPEYELPLRTPLLGLPEHRPVFGYWDDVAFALALVGAAGMFARGRGSPERRTFAILLACIASRSLLYGFASPIGVTERYLVEAYPLLLVFAAYGAAVALPDGARALRRRLSRRAATPSG
jgi:hypothetical protein